MHAAHGKDESEYGFKLTKFLQQYNSVYLKPVKVYEFALGECLPFCLQKCF